MISTLSTWFRRWIIIDWNLYQCIALKFLIFPFVFSWNACVWCYRTSRRESRREWSCERKRNKSFLFVFCLAVRTSKWKNEIIRAWNKNDDIKGNKKQQAEQNETLLNKPQWDMRIRENVVHRTNGIENLWFQRNEQNFCLLIWRRVNASFLKCLQWCHKRRISTKRFSTPHTFTLFLRCLKFFICDSAVL